jgi:F0F1-type ATP synthase assembly protein I
MTTPDPMKTNTRVAGLVILVVGIMMCLLIGWMTSFEAVAQCSILILATVLPLACGTLIIYRKLYNRKWSSLIAYALLLGFAASEFSFIGILLDPKSKPYNWQHIFFVVIWIGIATFVFVSLGSFLFMWLFRALKRARL